jgi:hypothetical protein
MVNFFLYITRQPLVGQGLIIIEALRSHSDTPHSVTVLWKSDRPVPINSTVNTQQSQATVFNTSGGIRTGNPSKPALYHAGHWCRHKRYIGNFFKITSNSLLHKHQNIMTNNKDTRAYFLPCFPELVQKPDASN